MFRADALAQVVPPLKGSAKMGNAYPGLTPGAKFLSPAEAGCGRPLARTRFARPGLKA